MTKAQLAGLRQETIDMFYHGFDHYMDVAFPEDELRPISCVPLTRDRDHPENIGVNDVLGNYSLTLIDTLSTLAVFASSPDDRTRGATSLERFQNGVELLVETYGDGSEGPKGQGTRGRGFDVDSKVQVFETVIRGVGGLLSAHLFAVGELPIRGYPPRNANSNEGLVWPGGFVYDGQLLRLARDLGERLLPAFHSTTGVPYPRVNLRHGIPFYPNSPSHLEDENPQCRKEDGSAREITENCSAGAGTLVLELSTLSRLTGDNRFEIVAKRAFWEVWNRRSVIGLVGSGIDSENGLWTSATTGIGAGVDSFFEYALKSHIILSGQAQANRSIDYSSDTLGTDPAESQFLYRPLLPEQDSAASFLAAWQNVHAAVKRHLYRDTHHPHYINAHINTGSPQALWIDSLGAYYPGLLVLAGELDEAIETHLLYAALWTRYSALPERWSTRDGHVEGGLGWWPGRPEFIESNYHLYRATKDPWYLHVGEMVLRDIKRRCWTKCGWAGLQDVRTGELTDRMESFFLGETAKYLFLLFDSDHPLNHLDAPFVFSTEGHPLIIPREKSRILAHVYDPLEIQPNHETCPNPPVTPLTGSATAAREDVFHAASLTRLHLIPNIHNLETPLVKSTTDHPGISIADVRSPTNYTFYPWTLPANLIPFNGTSSKMATKNVFEIQFPANNPNPLIGHQSLVRVTDGLMINSLEGVRLGLIQEDYVENQDNDLLVTTALRIHSIGNFLLGRDEKVYVKSEMVGALVDPTFTRIRDSVMIDLVIELRDKKMNPNITEGDVKSSPSQPSIQTAQDLLAVYAEQLKSTSGGISDVRQLLGALFGQVTSLLGDNAAVPSPAKHGVIELPAILPTGIGAAPLPDVEDARNLISDDGSQSQLSWTTIFLGDEACNGKLPRSVARDYQVIVLKRGECSFSTKLANIPSYPPSRHSLKLVIVVSFEGDAEPMLTRPLLDTAQVTAGGLTRHNQISMVMVGGGETTYRQLANAKRIGIQRRYQMYSQGLPIHNIYVI
ncbi:MAG: hypothetical protein M4579_002991 [Chaenotheca gracillima]|nr:MAG: hypothetical protein M4579_002991 [Chaenotheca gracillima]